MFDNPDDKPTQSFLALH